jgi:centromeric protein E
MRVSLLLTDVPLADLQTPEREFLLRVSYLEIYNEVINDLLCPSNTNVKVHETAKVLSLMPP